MTHDPLDPRPADPKNPRVADNRLGVDDPARGPYRATSGFGSPTQILVGLVLVIAVVVGLGLLFANDTSDVQAPQITESQPQ